MPLSARRVARRLIPDGVRSRLIKRFPLLDGPEPAHPASPAPTGGPAQARPTAPAIPPILVAPDLAAGKEAAAGGFLDRAWALLAGLPIETWATEAADEYVRSGLHADPTAVLAQVRALAQAEVAYVPSASWLALTSRVFGYGDQELARVLFTRLDAAVDDGSGEEAFVVESRDWLRPWVAASNDAPAAPAPPPGTVSYAVVDYGHPGRARASANIGDHVQTLASLGHVVRHQDLEFTGQADLDDLARRLRDRVRPERARRGLTGTVQLMTLERDASMYQEVPPDTWMLGFGWYMHAIFEMRYGFPFHANLRPIFVSFHCSKRDLLTPEAIDYLKQYAPIGCRDWTTVDILLSAGVSAFFSGCLTTTVDTVFPDLDERPPADAPVGYVDVPEETVPDGAPTYRQSDDRVRFRPFVQNLDDAIAMLENYRRSHRRIVTSRLHCYLPGRSIGIDIDFRPKNLSDPRFAGLNPITDEEFRAIRSGINDKLEQVLGKALGGARVEDVYALWRELTAAEVAAARERLAADHVVPALSTTTMDDVAQQVVHTPRGVPSDALHVAVVVRRGERPALRRLLRSLAAYASRHVHVWVLARGADLRLDELARPGLTLTALDTSGISQLRQPDGTTLPASQLDRLVLPDLLPDVDRLVLLPVTAVLAEDVAGLADIGLDGTLLAAASVVGTKGISGFAVVHGAASKQRVPAAAAELRRAAHHRHAFDFDAFDADVLVLDARQWRDRGLLAALAPLVQEYGFSYRALLHFEVGPHRTILPERWNVFPDRSTVTDPALVRLPAPPKRQRTA